MTNSFWLDNAQRARHALPLLVLIAALCSVTTLQAQVYNVTSYPLPQGQSALSNIVTGSDGNLWFISSASNDSEVLQYYANSVTPSGTVTQYSLASIVANTGSIGASITAGPDGNLWFTAGGGATAVIAQITTAGAITTFPVPNSTAASPATAHPVAIATGSDGNLWFTDSATARVWKYTLATGVFTNYPLSNPSFGITAGPDNNLWITEYSVQSDPDDPYDFIWSGSVALVTVQGAPSEYPLPQQSLTFFSDYENALDVFTTGPDGALWFTEYNGTQIGRVTTAGAVTTVYTGATSGVTAANGITTGSDGALWFTQPYNDGANQAPALVRLATSGSTSAYALDFSTFFSPNGITSGPDGALWFNDSGDAVVGRAVLPLAIATSSLPNGSAGTAYNSTLQSQGGALPLTWSVPPSTLPTGLQLSSAGVISGIPTAAGTFSFTVTATDSSSSPQTATQQLSIMIAAGAPASILGTSGGGQTAQVRTAFSNPLVVTVTDSDGNPVPAASVTFTAPASGASGTFAGAGTTVIVASNATGVASSPVFTANATAGPYAVNAIVAGAAVQASFALTNTAGAAGSVTVTSGNNQSAPISSPFSSPLAVTVTDASGNPVSNVTVTFTAPGAGASGTFSGVGTATAQTNALGVATSPTFTANSTAGNYTVSATVAGVNASASFALTNTAGGPASITATSGSGQSVQINSAFSNPLVATVLDAGGNPVANASVTFTAPGAGASGTFSGVGTAVAQTNASGVATSPTFTANATSGGYSVSATVTGVNASASFALTNTAGGPASITATSGGGQSAQINTAFGSAFAATVKDAGGNPVSNVSVTFTAPGAGASGTFSGIGTATAQTNASGVATSPTFTANATAGAYAVNASVTGVAAPASFALTNTAGVPASITTTSGSGQSAQINNTFGSALVATVKDSGGNPVANASVTFTAPPSGASGTFAGAGTTAIAQTNASGMAASPAFTADSTVGNYSVNAIVNGVSASASFALTNAPGAPASIATTSGSGQTAQIGNTFGSALVATVKDIGGNPVPNVTVTFTAPGSGAGGAFSGVGTATAQTNASGQAISPAITANSTAGSYTVNATVTGVAAPASFALTNNAGAPASITAASGSGQSAQINSAFSSPLVVTVKDSGGNLVANASVTFTAPPAGASGTFAGGGITATVQTNGSGAASSPTFTANTTAGAYAVNASVTGVAAQAAFALTNNAGAPASITATSGSGQNAQVRTAFSTPLVVTVKDSGNNPVSNVTVTFTAPGSGASGTFAGAGATVTVQTNLQGVATSPVLTANATAGGPYSVTAIVSGVSGSASFSLTNLAGAPGSITMTNGTGQFAVINTVFASPLVVTVKDSNGNPVANATVIFVAPGSGASGTFAGAGTTASAQTNASGVATSPTLTANGTAGVFNLSAAVAGAATPVTFIETNTAGTASSITALSGGGQTARVHSAFSNPLIVAVKDSNGNPVSSANVTFTAPTSGASGTFAGGGATATVQTISSGVATSPVFTANATAGPPYSVTAAVAGVSAQATFSLTNVAGLVISTTTLANGTTGLQYSVILTTVAGTPPYTWSISSGTLPTGLTLNAQSGAITGTPTTTGTSQFTVKVTDSSTPAQTATQALSLVINPPALVISTTALLNGMAGMTYSATLTGKNGSLPYVWSISSGTLPQGLTLNAQTGVISGTTTDAGTFSFTVKLTDSGTPPQSATQAFSLTITPASGSATPTFTLNGIPATQAPGTNITNATVELSSQSGTSIAGTLTLSFAPNTSVAGLPDGYTGDAGFVSSSGTKSTTVDVSIPALTTSVPLPTIDPGTVAGEVTVNLAVPGQNGATSTITVNPMAPIIEANSVQITNVTATGFDVEMIATSTTRELTNATFTFTAAPGTQISGTSVFTVDVSSLLSQWFASSSGLSYGGAFTLTMPFSLSGTASAIQSVSVTLANSVGTSTAVSGTQ